MRHFTSYLTHLNSVNNFHESVIFFLAFALPMSLKVPLKYAYTYCIKKHFNKADGSHSKVQLRNVFKKYIFGFPCHKLIRDWDLLG